MIDESTISRQTPWTQRGLRPRLAGRRAAAEAALQFRCVAARSLISPVESPPMTRSGGLPTPPSASLWHVSLRRGWQRHSWLQDAALTVAFVIGAAILS